MNIDKYDHEVRYLNNEMLAARAKMSASYISVSNKLVKKAKELDDISLLGYAYYYLADAYYLSSTDYRKFNSNLLKAIEYLQISGDAELLARCYNMLGIDALNHGNSELALDFFFTGLKYCDGLEHTGIPGFIEFNMGQTYYKFGDIKTALSCIKSASKMIRANKAEGLYYRNLVYCYCFEADCYIHLDKPELLKKSLEEIEKIERTENSNPGFFNSPPVVDTKMRSQYYLGNKEEFQRYSDQLMGIIREGKYSLDHFEDIIDVARFFMHNDMIKKTEEIISLTGKSLDELSIANLKLDHAKLRCELCSYRCYPNDKEKAFGDFYKYSLECEKEKKVNYQFFANVRRKLSEMEHENRTLIKQAETDSLTGLGNRYALNKCAEHAFEVAVEKQTSLAVEVLDVDDFKKYNDSYGHQNGDNCLKKIGESINELCHRDSRIHGFRYGGDEFVIIYEDMTDDAVMKYALELRNAISNLKVSSGKCSCNQGVSISQGIRNSVPTEFNKLWDYMYAADNALYEVKETKKGEIALLHSAVISKTSLDQATFAGID